MKGLDEVTRDFVGLFERMGVPYAIMGGMAVRIHALPRPTFDVDFTASISREDLPEVYRAVEDLGFSIPAAQADGWVDAVRGLPVIKFQWFIASHVIDVDVFLAETPFQNELLKRRQRHGAEGWEGWFVTAEDLILLKLLADRPKDRVDIGDILLLQPKLDEAYLREWAGRLGVGNELETALNASRG